jgi:hypothetical protein
MQRVIRQSVFETNSSSTHSICVAKTTDLNIPSTLHFEVGDFGWEWGALRSTTEKASYLYTGIMHSETDGKYMEPLKKTLQDAGIDATFEEYDDDGYVDHSSELYEFLESLIPSSEATLSFLFSPFSYILTGNDNDENTDELKIVESYPHDTYFKGN